MRLESLELVTLVFYSVIMIVTILANGCAIFTLLWSKKLRTTSNYFIVSLSSADFCIGLITIPLRTAEILRPDYTKTIDYCRVAHSFTMLNFTASVANLVIITVDRYIAILHPYFYFRLNNNPWWYIGAMLGATWTSVILVTFMPIYGWGSNGLTGPRTDGLGICRYSETLDQNFILFILLSVLSTSFFVIIPMYIHIFVVATKHTNKVYPMLPNVTRVTQAATGTGGDDDDTANSIQIVKPKSTQIQGSEQKEIIIEGAAVNLMKRGGKRQADLISSTSTFSSPPPSSSSRKNKQDQQQQNDLSQESTSSIKQLKQTCIRGTKNKTGRGVTIIEESKAAKQRRYLVLFKTTKTMFLIVVIFLVSWLGFVVSTLMFIICKGCANTAVVLVATVIVYLGSALNPFVYWIRFKVFRAEMKRHFKRIFTLCSCCE